MMPAGKLQTPSAAGAASRTVAALPSRNVLVNPDATSPSPRRQLSDRYTSVLPIWADDMARYAGNPVIVGTDVSPKHSFVADPYLLVVNDRLYMFFEAFLSESESDRFTAGLGEIWMAESLDGYSWSNFRKVSIVPKHMSHPEALVYDGKVHIFYNHNKDGSIYHRSSPLDSFPDWNEETVFFTGSKHGWHHLVDFTILEHRGVWYLLGITGNQPSWTFRRVLGRLARASGLWAQDQWIRGRWGGRFDMSWDSDSKEIEPFPLLDANDYDWVTDMVEITSMKLQDRLWLSMGVCNSNTNTRAINTYAITELSPTSFQGVWIAEGFTFPLAESGWDDTNIHRSHVVPFNGQWIYVYDGLKAQEWKIGIAMRPFE